jgi:hypothetical protein
MKNIYFKVNRRYVFLYLLIVFVVFGIIASVPRIHAEGLSDIFGAIIPPGAAPGDYNGQVVTPPPGTGTPSYPYPTSTPGYMLPSGAPMVPPGDCTDGLNRALNRLDTVQSQVIPVYRQASTESGIPWEIFAAIHYVETGGSFSPNHTLTSGTRLGELEEDGVHTYYTLIESARAAAGIFRDKYGGNGGAYNDFRKLVSAFAGYNGTGNRQCIGVFPKPQTNYSGCPALYTDEDHLYPLACFDERHKDMWKIYCGYRQECANYDQNNPNHHKYSPGMVGALTIIAALQTRYQATPIPTQAAAAPTQPPAQTLRYFNQCDSAYQSSSFGTCLKDGETLPLLCAAGCVPTSVAGVIASYADPSYTPTNAASTLISRVQLSCNGSGMENQKQLLSDFSSAIEFRDITMSSGGLAADASLLKPFFDAGWTALARIGYKRVEYGDTERGHYIWITRIDLNNDIWAYDPYFVKPEIMGPNAQAPINMNALLRREYPYKGFTFMDVTKFMLVRKK